MTAKKIPELTSKEIEMIEGYIGGCVMLQWNQGRPLREEAGIELITFAVKFGMTNLAAYVSGLRDALTEAEEHAAKVNEDDTDDLGMEMEANMPVWYPDTSEDIDMLTTPKKKKTYYN